MIAGLVCGRPDGTFFRDRSTFPLIGRPMMVYPLLAARHARELQHVFLTTDSPAMGRVAERQGIAVLNRPRELTAAAVSLEAVVVDGHRQIVRTIGDDLEALVVLLCNAPTVTADMIDKAIEVLRSNATWDAVVSVSLHNEFSPQDALRVGQHDRLEPFAPAIRPQSDVYFADALVWVLRPDRYFAGALSQEPWLMNFVGRKVAPLVHEGYGDVDYLWQVPAVEGWLRRRGFTEEATPYDATPAPLAPISRLAAAIKAAERRVFITTVPFGEVHRRALDLLETAGIEYTINPIGRRLKENELAELAGEFGVLIAGTEPITARVMDAAPHLRLISRVGIGLDNVDLLAARERGILVTYTPDAPSPAVAELTLGMMLGLLRHISAADRGMRSGAWRRLIGRRLDGLTVGVVGVGRVGKRVIRLLRGAFPGVRILANDIAPDLDFGHEQSIGWVDKDTLYANADIMTLHLPLTPLTHRLITMRQIELMKPSALVINTARGGLVDEHDLAEALRSGRIQGAAVDVYEHEPYTGELATIEACLLTCHMGSMSEDRRAQMELEATEEAIRFLRNEPLQRMVPECEYAAIGLRTR